MDNFLLVPFNMKASKPERQHDPLVATLVLGRKWPVAAILTHSSPFYPPLPARLTSYSSCFVWEFDRSVNKVFIVIVLNYPVMSQVREQAGRPVSPASVSIWKVPDCFCRAKKNRKVLWC